MCKTIIILSLLVFIGCGQKKTEKSIPKDTITHTIKASKSIQSKPDFENIGFKLMKDEAIGEVKLGMHLTDLDRILGKPSEKKANEFWDGDGEYHQEYNYENLGISLDMIGEKDKDKTVNMITATNPSHFKTKRGIAIGSAYEEVANAYHNEINTDFSTAESIVAGSIYGGIVFGFENRKLSSIFIGASAE